MHAEIRAVLDTNVLLRIILSSKKAGVAAALWQQFELGRFRLVTSEALLLEFQRVLEIPKAVAVHGWTVEEIAAYVDDLRHQALVTPGTAQVDLAALARRDLSDVPFVVSAVEGRASYLVTQDPDLLDLGEYQGIRFVDPLEFLRSLRSTQQNG